jgi:aminopeptidase N
MKSKITFSLFCLYFLVTHFLFAQNRQPDGYFCNEEKNAQNHTPKVLPTEVQKAYDVKWYFLNLNAENNTVALSGDVTIKAQVVWNRMDTFSFHLHEDYTVDRILINGEEKQVINNGHERMVTNLAMPQNTVFNAQIFYHGIYSGSGGFLSAGISSEYDDWWGGFNVTYTLSEANNAFHWFPVKQDLTDKADSSWVFVTTTKPNMVASNGLLTNKVELPNNKVRYEWKSSYPIDYYLISIAIAPYQDYSIYATIPQTGEQLLIQNYIYDSPECLSDNKNVMDATKDMIEYYSEIFGEYPFSREKYGHALAPMGGAMEHQTMTTTGYFEESIIAHELAHQWFGDNVTCASWQHIWLNEGFARYGELLWNEHKIGKESAFRNFKSSIINNVINFGKTGSVFVPIEHIDNENRIFNNTLTYNKGGTLVHLIRYELGDNDNLFFNVLQTYQNRFKDNVATAEDFKNVLEELSDIDFTPFFEQWYYGEGYPMFDIKWYQLEDKLIIQSVQTTTAPSVTPLFKVAYDLKITYNDNSTEIISLKQNDVSNEFSYNIPNDKTVKSLSFDPNNWLLATATIAYSPNSIADFPCENLITVFPNPTTGKLQLTSDELQEISIEVFDIYGKKLSSNHHILSSSNPLINISHLSSGLYFLRINGQTIKVVKE